MKHILLALFLPTICFAQSKAPDRIGDFIVGQTTILDFENHEKEKGHLFGSDLTEIDDYGTLDIYYINKDQEEAYPVKSAYEIKDKETDTTSAWFYSSPMTENSRVYFFSQIDVDGLYANNVFLRFYNDTLIEIHYNTGFELLKIFKEKYKGQSYKTTSSSKISSCKMLHKGKRFTNLSTTLNFIDASRMIISDINMTVSVDSKCQNYNYSSVHIRLMKPYLKWMQEAGENLELRRKSLVQKSKETKKKQLNSF